MGTFKDVVAIKIFNPETKPLDSKLILTKVAEVLYKVVIIVSYTANCIFVCIRAFCVW